MVEFKRFRVVCIGAGYFAKFHIEAWMRIPNVELVAICDSDLNKARALAQSVGIAHTFTNLEEVHLSYDILDIITPPHTHYHICAEAIKHNVHIICQKPLAPNYKEALRLADLISTSSGRFMVHENFRFQPWYRKIKELLQTEIIGEKIFSIQHRMRTGDGWSENAYLDRQPYFRDMPRLLMHETGIHFIDVFRYLLGKVDAVYARLRKLNSRIAGEDCGLVIFNFANGCQGVFDANRYNESRALNPRYTFGEMVIEGQNGAINLHNDGRIYVKNLGRAEVEISYQHLNINFAGDCVFNIQHHFIDCLQTNKPFETNMDDYLINLKIEEAIYTSAAQGSVVLI